jgi:hypothetical protein
MFAATKVYISLLLWLIFFNCLSSCNGQPVFGDSLLHLDKTILLKDVKGRIDHLDINLEDQVLYVAALGNNTVEAVDLRTNKVVGSIKNMDEPQGVCYIPQHHEILIANAGNGECYFYNVHSFEKVATVSLKSDADDVRYDEASRKIYVGYGAGGIAVLDADTHQQIGDLKLPGHPESFQLDARLQLLFVNIPDAHMVAVIDLVQLKVINRWIRQPPAANFPMAIDGIRHHVFIGYRHPPKLIVMDGKSGQEIAAASMVGDADDLYFDGESEKIYVSGGDGYISVFQFDTLNTCKQIANVATSSGARTSLFIPRLKAFILAARAASGEPAKIIVYKTD